MSDQDCFFDSDGDTIPLTPESFAQDVVDANNDEIFAWLRPHSEAACAAFDASVNSTIKDKRRYEHERQFLHRISRERRARSVYSEDGQQVGDPPYQWSGAFKLSLKIPPRDPAKGWYLGTNYKRNTQEIDILLAPPKEEWAVTRIAANHARLFFHQESTRMMLEARHAVTLTKNGAEVITQSRSRVIENGELIQIGSCLYTFEYTNVHATEAFEEALFKWIKEYSSPLWAPNKLLSPSRLGEPRSLGKYYCSPSAFAKGTFGKISAGWASDGSAVAIKVLKDPKKENVKDHQRIMEEIGYHPNILQLLECVSHFDTVAPDAYCIYSPLAVGSLGTVLMSYEVDLPAMLTLSVDFLHGLLFLHNKGIMHRDINPNNLAVTSFNDIKGLIIDLDSATNRQVSGDHCQGTMPYLAPEIISLKEQRSTVAYDKSVDIWALGLSLFSMHTARPFLWKYFSFLNRQPLVVSAELHAAFHRKVSRDIQSAQDPRTSGFLDLIEDMTAYEAIKRTPASEALQAARRLKGENCQGSIVLRRAPKRSLDESRQG